MLGERGASVGRERVRIWREREGECEEKEREGEHWESMWGVKEYVEGVRLLG